MLNTDKNDITIKSIENPNSTEATENLVMGAKYVVTAEVRTAIDAATLIAQHPELNEAVGSAESGKFYGVADMFTAYAKEIDSISESFVFDDKEDGKKSFSHSMDLTTRKNSTHSAKTIAQTIATALFNEDVNNTYFGHNAFTGALQSYGNTADNKHYFEESYDLRKNKFSFTKKMEVLDRVDNLDATGASGTDDWTANQKYTIDMTKDGRVTVSDTTEIKSRDGNYDNIKVDLEQYISSSYTNCLAKLQAYNADIDGRGANAVAATLSPVPLTKSIIYDKQGLKATISLSFSNDVQVTSSQFLETVDLSRDHKGIVTATYNVTLTSHREKTLNADSDVWEDGYCSDGSYTDQATCEANSKIWTAAKTALDVLKHYDTNSLTRICEIVHFTNQAATVKGIFWNTLSWWWPYGSAGVWKTVPSESGCDFTPITTSVSTENMGKAFTFTRTFSNDAIYQFGKTQGGGLNHAQCPNCFKKVEIKWNDTWPKRTVSEHLTINRGTSPITKNIPLTSVVTDSYVTQPGKRSVTINAIANRPVTSLLSSPAEPNNELIALAHEARNILLEVFQNPRINDSYQFVYYLSNLSYTYDSDNSISLTSEITYTYKKPPPFDPFSVTTAGTL